MNFKIGDRVRFLNDDDGGIVCAMRNGKIVVEDEHGFEWEMEAAELVADTPHLDKQYNIVSADLESKLAADLPNSLLNAKNSEIIEFVSTQGRNTYLEIDLHINELVDRTSNLSNHDMVTIQIRHFKRFLSLARKEKYQKMVVIHGVGAGVLKTEIRQILSEMTNCSFHDADFGRYGRGATEIRLWYN